MMKRFSCGCCVPIHHSHHRVGTVKVDYPCSQCRISPKNTLLRPNFRTYVAKRTVVVVKLKHT